MFKSTDSKNDQKFETFFGVCQEVLERFASKKQKHVRGNKTPIIKVKSHEEINTEKQKRRRVPRCKSFVYHCQKEWTILETSMKKMSEKIKMLGKLKSQSFWTNMLVQKKNLGWKSENFADWQRNGKSVKLYLLKYYSDLRHH